ncbi:MAG TPA: D-alanyl-D-alanine carboxypeptidase [Clostridiales bacterium]|jgi:D-alanyl-D-alanine carboxypeptidase (penicillin-binding protein 5/6)|nr:D-alanyl-D-alanine carboxypeptidase [Clostridiales bacterium]
MESWDDITWQPAVEAVVTMDNIKVAVPSAILMEKSTGQILYEHNSHQRLAPASITKIMTILLIVEAIENGTLKLDETVTVSSHAAKMGGSQIYLEEGEQMSLEEILKAVIVCSANDGSVALAEHLAGSEAAFVEMMNNRAAELGMKDTVFANCTGLPTKEEHLTSAHDVALMSRALIKHDMVKKYTTIWMDTVRNGEFGITNTNRLVRFFNGTTGLKTGFTEEAMYCLSATAEREGVEFIAVVMHAETSDIRFEAAKSLLNYAFATYTLQDARPGEVLPPVPVKLGKVSYIQPVIEGETSILIRKSDATGIAKEVELVKDVEAPVAAGQKLGTLTVRGKDGKIIKELPLVAADEVGKLNWWEIFTKYILLMVTGSL